MKKMLSGKKRILLFLDLKVNSGQNHRSPVSSWRHSKVWKSTTEVLTSNFWMALFLQRLQADWMTVAAL